MLKTSTADRYLLAFVLLCFWSAAHQKEQLQQQ
jgi:hypothetical protein